MNQFKKEAEELAKDWKENPRWKGVQRDYSAEEVIILRGSLKTEHTFAQKGAERFWELLHTKKLVRALGALTGGQAVEMIRGGLEAIYLSGWQVAADNNTALQTYPDQSLYPVNSVPTLVERINYAFQRADQIEYPKEREFPKKRDWFAPIIADAEAGFGGPLNAHELMKAMIRAGAAAVHYEDQLGSEKKCGHLGGKVLVPTRIAIKNLTAARLAADIMGVPTVIIGRTDANAATLVTNDIDERDQKFLTGERTWEGYHWTKCGLEAAIARAVAYAPYCDLLWCETSNPDLDEAKRFAEGVHEHYPAKLLSYNCSPSFPWSKKLDASTIMRFQDELAEMGYRYQFITLAGFHQLKHGMFELAKAYAEEGMPAYVRLQDKEFASEKEGYTAVKHQAEVGTGYFDKVAQVISGGQSSTSAMEGSTEKDFH